MLVQVKHQKVTEHTLLKKLTEYVERVDTDMVSIAHCTNSRPTNFSQQSLLEHLRILERNCIGRMAYKPFNTRSRTQKHGGHLL